MKIFCSRNKCVLRLDTRRRPPLKFFESQYCTDRVLRSKSFHFSLRIGFRFDIDLCDLCSNNESVSSIFYPRLKA